MSYFNSMHQLHIALRGIYLVSSFNIQLRNLQVANICATFELRKFYLQLFL